MTHPKITMAAATDELTVHLTPSDTRLIYEDAIPCLQYWAAYRTLAIAGDPINDGDPVVSWSVEIREIDTDKVWTIDHDKIIAAMVHMVEKKPEIHLRDEIIDQIGLVLAAPDNESATDEICQLDVIGFNAIVQVATLGQVENG
jgi:hypothetical protein